MVESGSFAVFSVEPLGFWCLIFVSLGVLFQCLLFMIHVTIVSCIWRCFLSCYASIKSPSCRCFYGPSSFCISHLLYIWMHRPNWENKLIVCQYCIFLALHKPRPWNCFHWWDFIDSMTNETSYLNFGWLVADSAIFESFGILGLATHVSNLRERNPTNAWRCALQIFRYLCRWNRVWWWDRSEVFCVPWRSGFIFQGVRDLFQ